MEQPTYPQQSLKWLLDHQHYKRCPKCKIGHLDKRVPRPVAVKMLFFWADLKRYRCNTCRRSFYARTNRE